MKNVEEESRTLTQSLAVKTTPDALRETSLGELGLDERRERRRETQREGRGRGERKAMNRLP